MKNIKMLDSNRLLACFFSDCENQFRFLEDEHDYSYFSGIVTYRHNHKIIVPCKNPEEEAHPFVACARYEHKDWAIEILFDEENMKIDQRFYHKGIHRFSKDDLLKSAKKTCSFKALDKPVVNEQSIYDTSAEFADFLKRYQNWVLDPNDKFIERALTMKERLLEQQIRQKFEKDMRDISEMAAKAFMQKNYKKVIRLLMPYKQTLTGADQKKLTQARDNIEASI